jgi:hypothetical protein
VEVAFPPSAGLGRPPWGYEVVLGGGRVVRVPSDFDSATLSRLLSVVDGSC